MFQEVGAEIGHRPGGMVLTRQRAICSQSRNKQVNKGCSSTRSTHASYAYVLYCMAICASGSQITLCWILSLADCYGIRDPKFNEPSIYYGVICHARHLIMQLAIRPTPIHHWDLPGLPKEFQVFIKRDDMTGSTLGGNKVYSVFVYRTRKLQIDEPYFNCHCFTCNLTSC